MKQSSKLSLVRGLYLFSMALMIAAVPLSRYLMSVAQFSFAVLFLWEGAAFSTITDKKNLTAKAAAFFMAVINNMLRKFKAFFSNTAALAFSSILLYSLLATLYSADIPEALRDMRNKLPFFLLSLYFSSAPPLSKAQVRNYLLLFIAAVAGGVIYSLIRLYHFQFEDVRLMTTFISHIRFSLNVCLAILISIFFIISNKIKAGGLRMLLGAGILLMLFYLITLRSFTGIYVLFFASGLMILRHLFIIKRHKTALATLVLFFIIPFLAFYYLKEGYKDYSTAGILNIQALESHTPEGNPYLHDTLHFSVENGRYSGLYICDKEARISWNKRSIMSYDSLDKRGQELRHTLIRYMSSKGLKKDRQGLMSLSDDDINNIENGIANTAYLDWFGFKARLFQMYMAYDVYRRTGNPSGSSYLERVEMWKHSLMIIKEHPLFGVGTGDLKDAFKQAYKKSHSPLKDAKGGLMSSHNQYLNILVRFGIVGLLYFIFAISYPLYKRKKQIDFPFLAFIFIALLSMFTDDSLKNQAGLTFFTFFYTFFIFARDAEDEEIPEGNQKQASQ